ncbi:MAG: hypothetical protein IIC66_06360 [candidate division Zixibacteria bacterium]|nr:hypothetical protein [candidate division Zixibacteria bacterium]
MRYLSIFALLVITSILAAGAVAGEEISYDFIAETRLFPSGSAYNVDDKLFGSFSAELEYYHEWTDRNEQLVIVPFVRLDANDSQRSHFDLRELFWQKRFSDWNLSLGFRKVFWGQTEGLHLVDIINQTDWIENIDGEDKLGQPMIQATWLTDRGTFDLFWLPYFRERTFAGKNGRLRPSITINTDKPQYESDAEEWHQDWALRWYHTLGQFDIGLSFFSGTERQPLFQPRLKQSGQLELLPYYYQTKRIGLDLLYISGGWIWKLEALSIDASFEDRKQAFTGGFEYTLVGLSGSQYDLGLLAEYMYDDRGSSFTPFEHDLLIGGRLAFNNVSGTDLLGGLIIDTDIGSVLAFIEMGTRLSDWWSLDIEFRGFFNQASRELLYDLRDDDLLQVQLTRHM